ncbi:Retrovirus-related Pol poly [Paramuricea clavata]|uniref:Retrovirus-related Pol poly n=1 Tax=Paramuricea clavata TaxID=317549 RepID=A0A6S7J898_PARCT|nr:Retrovirus-related Pol poly [Paramuricea clavata]
MIIDTGASINIIDENTFANINKYKSISLKRTRTKLFAYGSKQQLPVIGTFEATIETKKRMTISTIHVVRGNYGSLLSYQTATELNLIKVNVNNVKVTGNDKIEQCHDSRKDKMDKKFPHLFHGIGKLHNFEAKLHIDSSVPPVAQPARRIPFYLRRKVSAALKQLEKDDIIEKVEGPTPWISPLVVIPKNDGTVRLCVDMRRANCAIQRERHPCPTVDDLIHAMNGAKVFSKLDLRSGYHQLLLAEESRYITTFVTHKGLRRYKRLNFGTNSASELFQKVIHDQIHDIPGAINISDDVIIYRKSQQEHDTALHNVCQRFTKVGLTLNNEKCQFSQTKLTFFGMVFSAEGISADPHKVSAIKNASPPSSVKDVRSFLGMATYCAKFIPNFSHLSEPLRKLTMKSAQFRWTRCEQTAFDNIKNALTSDTVMAYFDQTKPTELITDASPWGLSAILAQNSTQHDDRRIVAYVSRSLSEVERKYSQTEREALAIVWAMERLQIYLRGGKFTLYTDCKPIELILGNPKSKPLHA